MRITHYGHSCVVLETGSARLMFDPGAFSTGFEDVTGLDAILITHQHPDHIDEARLPALIAANPNAQLIVDQGTAAVADKLELAATVAKPGDVLHLGGTKVEVIGGQHATIYQDYPGITNNGYLVEEGAFLHPGDSLPDPGRPVDVLGLPTAAPWLKLSEAVDYLRAVAPRIAVPIHQGVLSEAGKASSYNWFTRLKPDNTEVLVLPGGELITI